ncbi:MAG TPA: hypothetical protein VMS17_00815, partial [Gemmataceae bacterium]|nr:hypothetical protein [Gemmataceae bacterium]
IAAGAASALGCRTDRDVVERELHARELDLQAAREEIDRCHAINEGLQMELQAQHGDPSACPPGASDKPAVAIYPIRSLTLGRQTGGRDGDAAGGDEALQVVVQPLDPDNQPVKIPGQLLIQALEITPAGLKQPLSTWQISDDELRRSWRSGLLGAGYFLVLPWKVWPSNDKLRVVATLQLPDGRLFQADKDVTVRVVPAEKRPPAPPAIDEPVLPPPHPLPPPTGGPNLPPPSPALPAKSTAAKPSPGRGRPAAELLPAVPVPACWRP